MHYNFTWNFGKRPVYCAVDEEFDQAGTVCALFGYVITADRLGGKSLSHGACADDGQHAAKVMIYAIA
jgi:hypothetical protein